MGRFAFHSLCNSPGIVPTAHMTTLLSPALRCTAPMIIVSYMFVTRFVPKVVERCFAVVCVGASFLDETETPPTRRCASFW